MGGVEGLFAEDFVGLYRRLIKVSGSGQFWELGLGDSKFKGV